MKNKLCAIIVTYNHYNKLDDIIKRLSVVGLRVFIVDDGSNAQTRDIINKIVANNINVSSETLPSNQGKGVAVAKALRTANREGFTHAFQIDADGQHSLDNILDFVNLSITQPTALISGVPVYDKTIPLTRKIGRWFTHVWVWIETLSLKIKDSMCGYRIYPVQQTLQILDNYYVGKRMDFDTDIMVRLCWLGVPIVMAPVKVTYPNDNISNFDPLLDNWRITKMHTRLFFGMLTRLPCIVSKRFICSTVNNNANATWSSIHERGTLIGLLVLITSYRVLGRTICILLSIPVVLYFYWTGPQQRKASCDFLNRVFEIKKIKCKANFFHTFYHYINFFIMMLDNFAAVLGKIKLENIQFPQNEDFVNMMDPTKGAILFVSHHGNMGCCRAIAMNNTKKKIYVLMHTKNSQKFNTMIKALNPQTQLNIIEVTLLTPDVSIRIKQYIDEGALVAIAVDRIPIVDNNRISKAQFLGDLAAFPQGPYILACLLDCPVYLGFAVRQGKKYIFSINKYVDRIVLTRGSRNQQIDNHIKKYVTFLEEYCIKHPYQWFNFFDYWENVTKHE